MKKEKRIFEFLTQQRKREEQLLSNVLKCFEKHKENTLRDLEVLKHNIEVTKE